MKACFFDYIYTGKSGDPIDDEIIKPIRKKGYSLDHRIEMDLPNFINQYDIIILHPESANWLILKHIKKQVEKPTLIIAGRHERLQPIQLILGFPTHVEYELASPENLINFIKKYLMKFK